jgi:uncharacterized membrane protein
VKHKVLSSSRNYAILQEQLPTVLFLLFAVVQGTIFIQSIGALTIPDTDIHANATYALSTGQAFSAVHKDVDSHGNEVNIQTISGDSRFLSRQGTRNETVEAILADYPRLDDSSAKASQELISQQSYGYASIPQVGSVGNRSNQYFPLAYVPQAVGFKIADLAGMPAYTHWQAARIANFVLFLILGALAIGFAPCGKYLFMLLLLQPPLIFVASSLMLDGLLAVVAALAVASLMRVVSRGEAAPTRLLMTFALCCNFLILEKFVYGVIALLLLAVPSRKVSIRKKLAVLASCIVTLSVVVLWTSEWGGMLAIVNTHDTMMNVVHHPGTTLVALSFNTVYYVIGLMRHRPITFIFFFVAIIVVWVLQSLRVRGWVPLSSESASSHRNATNNDSHNSFREFVSRNRYLLIAFAAFILAMFMTLGLEIITWNSTAALSSTMRISGWQERYIYPLLFLLPFAYCLESVTNTSDELGPEIVALAAHSE